MHAHHYPRLQLSDDTQVVAWFESDGKAIYSAGSDGLGGWLVDAIAEAASELADDGRDGGRVTIAIGSDVVTLSP